MGQKDDDREDDLESGSKSPLLQQRGAPAQPFNPHAPAPAGPFKRPGAASRIGRLLGVRNGTARVVLAAAVASAWMFFSSLLILLNKHILKDLKFP
ncbi:hypothetical protein MNEG_13286 [Monoraphidium neglectum]|uniref:Uncharacterized protein n=1 Tax=Monoraphidium neglectum TaxID=145388 RepID=A0A0D2MI83_9CHLO|nr:hypothetical protein MNEG_13286 [Monoraphidium neglectum]KIY94675.1 hypothetical protein MNEG_13286 [Monoraphidium neglectum]|eukprot:XP_013893695.1 hypothetical protein MNEG_13286 [Monoraphidium neglectum]